MSEFADIFGGAPKEQPPIPAEKSFDKEAWAAEKKAERDNVYAMLDDITAKTAADPALFQRYLDTGSRFDRYTAANTLLVMAQKPEATQLHDLDYWKAKKIYIKKDELKNPILILEPGNEYQRDDNTVGTSFNVKRVYDVSQAERRITQRSMNYSDRAVILALKKTSPVDITVVNELPDNRGAMYDPQNGRIQLRLEGLSAADIIRSLSREIAMAELTKDGNQPQSTPFKAYSASYVICKKYGVDVSGYKFEAAKSVLAEKESGTALSGADVRRELTDIKNVSADLLGRMNKALEQARNEKSQEAR